MGTETTSAPYWPQWVCAAEDQGTILLPVATRAILTVDLARFIKLGVVLGAPGDWTQVDRVCDGDVTQALLVRLDAATCDTADRRGEWAVRADEVAGVGLIVND